MNTFTIDGKEFTLEQIMALRAEADKAAKLVKAAEKAGFIERRPNPEDRRGTLIVPAKSGAEKAASWFESARKAQYELISSYPEKELEIIADVFERFTKLWEQEREKLRRDR